MLDAYDIRDLRLHPGRDLRTLLTEESAVWRRDLLWDYSGSIELLMGYLDQRILPGFVAIERRTGQVHGYTFAVFESQKAVVGDLFAYGPRRLELQRGLLRHLLPMLQHTPGVERVESQLLVTPEDLQPGFTEAGFRSYPRLFMQAALPDQRELIPSGSLVRSDEEPTPELGSLRLRRWTAPMYQPAADLIHRAYVGHGDTEINDQYRTVQGCMRFLHNIVRFPGCGTFTPEHTWVLVDERSGELDGLLLTTRVESNTTHIPQLCLAPRRRGRGLGRMMMRHAATELARAGQRTVTLTVTEANTSAMHLYRDLGFTPRHRFHAAVWWK
ncbi:GNAT family N-acetyltransferase [Terriglobus aquaticus]|uniref:GNAT family N-acetyltransferase n=1 Tax=Terriglobus aquaticus TaxID=940139 RepID=A0ABW9KP44_9BACT|nr:GNAT family N-acetyltransferase [Terriglobus aquaticus]